MVAYGGGLSASLGVTTEATAGTEATGGMGWYEFTDDSMAQTPTFLDSQGLKAGQAYQRVARTQISKYDVSGDITLEHFDKGTTAASGKGMGFWWRHALGSAVTGAAQVGGTASLAYRQNHVPGTKDGLAFTAQLGRPETTSPFTVRALTYRGCKVGQWEFSCNDGQLAQLKLTVDGWREATGTALVSPTFAGSGYQAGIFSFADATTFTLGGTATTTTGTAGTVIAGGVAVATVVKGITITGNTPLADDRFGLGNAGVKREQLMNGIPMITGQLNGEFTSRAEIYDLFVNNTTTALQIDFVHGDAGGTGATGFPYKLSLIMPAVKFQTAAIKLNGADILGQDIAFKAYDDGSGSNPPIAVQITSTDQVI